MDVCVYFSSGYGVGDWYIVVKIIVLLFLSLL